MVHVTADILLSLSLVCVPLLSICRCKWCCNIATWFCLTDEMEVLTDHGFMSRAEVCAICPELVDSSAPATTSTTSDDAVPFGGAAVHPKGLPPALIWWAPSSAEQKADEAAGVQHINNQARRGVASVSLLDGSSHGRQCGGCSHRVWASNQSLAYSRLRDHILQHHADEVAKPAAGRSTRARAVSAAAQSAQSDFAVPSNAAKPPMARPASMPVGSASAEVETLKAVTPQEGGDAARRVSQQFKNSRHAMSDELVEQPPAPALSRPTASPASRTRSRADSDSSGSGIGQQLCDGWENCDMPAAAGSRFCDICSDINCAWKPARSSSSEMDEKESPAKRQPAASTIADESGGSSESSSASGRNRSSSSSSNSTTFMPPASLPPLRFASLNPSTGHLVYMPATAVTFRTVTSLVEFTHAAEAPHWAADADEYGLTPDQATRLQRRSDRVRDGDEKHIERVAPERASNGVSLVVDTQHEMFAQVGWAMSNLSNHDWQSDFCKIKAGSLLSDDPLQRVKMTGQAEAGLSPSDAASDDELPFAAVLGLTTEEQLTAFFLLYGYWLGDGCLQDGFGGRTLLFCPIKPDDKTWVLDQLAALGLTEESGGFSSSGCDKADGQRNIFIRDERWTKYFYDEYGVKYGVDSPTSTHTGLTTRLPKSVKWFWVWVWRLRKKWARLVLSGLRFADGKEAGDENVIFTSGHHFRDEIVRLALHAGYSPHFKLVRKAGQYSGLCPSTGEPIPAQHDGWEVSYNESLAHAQPVLKNRRDIKRIDVPSGVQVWCPTVPPHNLIIARRATKSVSGVVTRASRPIVVGNCWGNTHFCADCHKRQEQGEYLTRKRLDELPQCDGVKCPLGVKHPPNGTEFALGCGICRQRQTF